MGTAFCCKPLRTGSLDGASTATPRCAERRDRAPQRLRGEVKLECEVSLGNFSRGHDQQSGKARIVTRVGARVAIAVVGGELGGVLVRSFRPAVELQEKAETGYGAAIARAKSGRATLIAQPGHDAWVVGDEPCVAVDFGPSAGQYATRRGAAGWLKTLTLGWPLGGAEQPAQAT